MCQEMTIGKIFAHSKIARHRSKNRKNRSSVIIIAVFHNDHSHSSFIYIKAKLLGGDERPQTNFKTGNQIYDKSMT